MAEPAGTCSAAKPPTVQEKMYQELSSGMPARGYVPCKEYFYYIIDVPSPCNNLNVAVTTALGSTRNSTAELSMSQWPTLFPVLDGLQWSSFEWGPNNYTISAFDPQFDGGKSCGADGRSMCQVIIGVYGYCAGSTQSNVDFTITATLQPVHKIFEVPQENQVITANGVNSYEFCVPTFESARVLLDSWDSSCTCPGNYANLDMVVSKNNPDATINDYAWRVGHTNGPINYIDLLTSDGNTRPGTYYVNMYGWCTPDSECADKCSCSPCSNVAKTLYSLLVAPLAAFTSTEGTVPLQSCPASSQSCSASAACASSSSGSSGLSKGAIAGIAIACIVAVAALTASIYCFFCRGSSKGGDFSEIDESSSMIQRAGEQPSVTPLSVDNAGDEREVELSMATSLDKTAV